MPVTRIEPRTALVLIDLQRSVIGLPTGPHPSADVVARCARLADAFRAADRPVVLVNVTGGAPGRVEEGFIGGPPKPDWTELVPELGRRPGDILVTKQRWNAFHGTALDTELRRHQVTQVVIAGISTSSGVESTARSAHDHGYHVTIPIDAITDVKPEAHSNSVLHVFPRMSETGTTEEVLSLLH
ncbi:isochorismatase family protein [Streptomyces sp. MBT62]|uniref:isochorismatase family protein n=1 Tax=Streptomyces sp. MBT62 TaxID=2800410 RepID=UPI00190D31E6|nr:isochorismatase family protein [Streptomyces sp. MBT62]MBK3565217.1 isochorismatase family protein [Streptomyces sp. MBT62]